MPDNGFLRGMVLVRLISAAIELTGALLMWRGGRLDLAVRINGLLGIVGPLVLTTTMALGLAGLAASRMPWPKLVWIGAGVLLILWGTGR
ncbi:MAG: YqhV family protein [Firmicutes bacterium]|nr:YqhV family protein [Alicyclobacillaceae bacterium]MCL6496391.1 YqhV family protein [Bacillota bacterium]